MNSFENLLIYTKQIIHNKRLFGGTKNQLISFSIDADIKHLINIQSMLISASN